MKKDKNKSIKKDKIEKTEKTNKFIETIKKKWIVNTSKTILLVAIIIACFIGVTVLMKKINLTPIDLTEEKVFTLSKESKEEVKDIDKDINIYFLGYSEDDPNIDLAKQYNKANEKITAEAVNVTERPDLAKKYGITGNESISVIIVECGDKSKVISQDDLYSYDMESGTSVSVVEERLTSAIKTVTTDELPKVYFLAGYSDFSLQNGMQVLGAFLANNQNEIDEIDVLTTGSIPDDCKTLVIPSPSKDFEEATANNIINYINNGGNILWLNTAIVENTELSNVNKVLATYGVKPFKVGVIVETDSKKTAKGMPTIFLPEIEYSDMTSKIYKSASVILRNATKVRTVTDEELEKMNVTKSVLLHTSEDAFFKTDLTDTALEPTDKDSKGEMVVGAQLDKKISDDKTSTMVIFGENLFVSDYSILENQQSAIYIRDNKDLILNVVAKLTDREEEITVRKGTGSITYTATEAENRIIFSVIIAIPAVIIVAGIIVWSKRKKKHNIELLESEENNSKKEKKAKKEEKKKTKKEKKDNKKESKKKNK